MLFYSLGINTLFVSTVRYESGEQVLESENEKKEIMKESSESKPGFIRMKKFHFIMLLFLVVFLSAGITTFALAFGDEKAVTVGTERNEFDKLYTAFDTLKNKYYEDVDQDTIDKWCH